MYPIEIKTANDFAPELAVLLETSWKAVMVAKGVSGLVRCFGLPSWQFPDSLEQSLKKMEESVKNRSYRSVEDYQRIDDVVMTLTKQRQNDSLSTMTAIASETQSVRGASLREFQRFLEKNDPKKEFAGLRKLYWDDGKVCWTLESNIIEMQKCSVEEVNDALTNFTLNTSIESTVTNVTSLVVNVHPATNHESSNLNSHEEIAVPPLSNNMTNEVIHFPSEDVANGTIPATSNNSDNPTVVVHDEKGLVTTKSKQEEIDVKNLSKKKTFHCNHCHKELSDEIILQVAAEYETACCGGNCSVTSINQRDELWCKLWSWTT